MKLNDIQFEKMKSGKKKIEIRLFDEKRQKLNVGDIIIFSKATNLNEKISAEIIDLLKFKTFQELVDKFPMDNFGYPEDYNKQNFIESIYKIYSKQEEQKYGVLGIKIKLLI